MSFAETRPILIGNNAGKVRAGTLHFLRFSDKERALRALRILGIMWALALLTAFIPIAHFVLVPGFLVAGPVMAVMRYRVTEDMNAATGECPTCGQAITVQLDPSAHLPVWTYCPGSNDPILLQAPESQSLDMS